MLYKRVSFLANFCFHLIFLYPVPKRARVDDKRRSGDLRRMTNRVRPSVCCRTAFYANIGLAAAVAVVAVVVAAYI